MRLARTIWLVPLAACSFDPALVDPDAVDPGELDASDVDAKVDASELPLVDSPPVDLDAPDAASPPDAACMRFGLPCSAPEDLGSISGDTGSESVTRTGNGDTWFRIDVTEDSGSRRTTLARVRLDMPADVDFDLHVICGSCGEDIDAFAQNGIGVTFDQLALGNSDSGNGSSGNDNFGALIHVVHYGGEGCGPWTLTITGNTSDSYFGCD